MKPAEIHSFRCDDRVWKAAGRKAKREHVSRSSVLAELLERWVAGEETPVSASH
jgi:hypothetical protein